MQRCLELARLGAGNVAPNPMVGCVIVHNNIIIAEGWHKQFGGAHAEVNALALVEDESLLNSATLYVNLEPCSHFGKTPPCANLLVQKNIRRVVVSMLDPNPLVAGKGIAILQDAGMEVKVGVLEDECHQLNKRYLTFIEKKRPYIILKWAQTHNGFIAPDASKMSAGQFEKDRHITGKIIQKLVHKWRTQEGAIMVGTNTALLDNPALNAREWNGKQPLRVVLDQHLRLPKHLKIYDHSQATWIVNGSKESIDGDLNYVQIIFSEDWFSQLLQRLYKAGIQSMIVEGGLQLLNHIIEHKAWDEAIVFYSPSQIENGIPAPLIGGKIIQQLSIDGVNMIQYKKI
ncbi:MAG: bifunctional diaminohydroxyphosphoribosylaminopyrimidine deaminase/5-amino-6-(5-phosphoribosylamino)uracil reductase RibD [Bacteroidia bacterium]|nr:bifunctional diaminohydroxyphosphoribosylaminopyrimidine deaminase/5-amino-6-(5-phosphoribosylamino)uracil reductase RibD [Bacteroidia bacterium]